MPEPRRVSITFRIGDLVSEQPAVGVTAQVCLKLDFSCSRPLSTGLKGDATGTLRVDLEAGFDGYVEISAPGRIPGIYFFNPPATSDREISSLPLLRPEDLLVFAGLSGKPLVQGRGHVMLGAYNCLLQPAEGVRLSSDDADTQTSPFYLVQKVPSVTAAATDISGRGGLINMRAGAVGVTGRLADGREVATLGLFIRADTITYTTLLHVPR